MFSISKRVSLSNWNIKSNVGVQILITIHEKYLFRSLLTKNPCSSERGFFIQAAGLVYHRRAKRGVYHQGRRAALASHHAPACIYLRLDDIPQQVADDIQGYSLIYLR